MRRFARVASKLGTLMTIVSPLLHYSFNKLQLLFKQDAIPAITKPPAAIFALPANISRTISPICVKNFSNCSYNLEGFSDLCSLFAISGRLAALITYPSIWFPYILRHLFLSHRLPDLLSRYLLDSGPLLCQDPQSCMSACHLRLRPLTQGRLLLLSLSQILPQYHTPAVGYIKLKAICCA
jgi:hypothetical protein